ncbi:MAG: DEAD/DEAH box helicase [Bdellovibrionales bacterium]|nr:DEAD/DEAH box helicase [Bdellovibrionales bacterium]
MKLPSLQDLKRSGPTALKKTSDPSALERGLQYLREDGVNGIEVATLGAKGMRIDFTLTEKSKTTIEFTGSSQPLFSNCDCSMSGYGIFCKHQAVAAWAMTAIASGNYDLTRVPEPVQKKLKSFENILTQLKSSSAVAPVSGGPIAGPTGVEFTGLVIHLNCKASSDDLGAMTEIPKGVNHQDRLLPDLALQYHRDTDLPHPLWRSPLSFRGTTSQLFQSAHEVARRKSIVYLFSDGTRIPVSEVLFHRNATLVPVELLPLNRADLDTSNCALQFFPKNRETPVWDAKAEEKLDSILLALIRDAGRALSRGKLKVYFSTPELFDHRDLALELSELDFKVPSGVKAGYQLAASPFPKVEIDVLHNPDWIWMHTCALQPNGRRIWFHGFHHWFENYPEKLELNRHGDLEILLERMKTEFHVPLNEILIQPPLQYLKRESFTPHLRVFSNGTFTVELEFDSCVVDGIPHAILKEMEVLAAGIRAWDDPRADQMFVVKKQAKRASDMRLLRHIGVAALIFQETVRHLIKTDKPFPEFFEQLKQKIAQLMNKLEGAPVSQNITLEIFCSKVAIEYLEDYVQHLIRLYTEQLFPLLTPKSSLMVEGVYAFYLKMLYAWITISQVDSQGSVLLRTKDGIIQNPMFEAPAAIKDLQLHPPGELADRQETLRWLLTKKTANPETLIRAFLPLQNDGVLLSLDDQSIEELHDEDFISEFILEETPDLQGRIDWFELHPKFFFKGVEIDEEAAKKLSETGMIKFQGKIYRLNQGSIPSLEKLTLFWEQLAVSQGPKRGNKKSDRIYRLPKHYTLELLALRSTGVRVKGGPIWDEICRFYDDLGGKREEFPIPKSFSGELKPYQHRGVQWVDDLYRLGLGGILADDMGLGKTVQTLVFLERLREKGQLNHTLIVVPTSLTYNWHSEAKRFTPNLPVMIFQSREIKQAREFLEANPQGILISTYGLMAEHEQFFGNYRWNVHVYDEAQNLKTITAKRTTVSRKIPARFKLCLTGTPLENHMGEFFSLMDLVVPGSLGAFDQFRKMYMQSYAPEMEKVQYLKLKTRPLVLRRTKSSILKELPPKSESTVKIPFTDKQLAIYRDIALSWNSRVRQAITEGGESKSQLIMLTALLRLRQVCSAPSAIPNVEYTEVPPKITLLIDNLKAIIETGESALVFTQFLGTFDLISRELKKAGIPHFSLHGKVSRKDRESQLQQFNEHPTGAVMLMTLKTGGVGLNLTKASYVFHLEPWWNPAVENQATDRTHRIGQTKPVQVYRYIMGESVEEKIEILKSRKSSQFNALFSDVETDQDVGDGGAFHLSQKDFEYLLGI